jgi:hypothetical protein
MVAMVTSGGVGVGVGVGVVWVQVVGSWKMAQQSAVKATTRSSDQQQRLNDSAAVCRRVLL